MGDMLVATDYSRSNKHISQHTQPNKHRNESSTSGTFALTRSQPNPPHFLRQNQVISSKIMNILQEKVCIG